jgi:hypothetical protein
LNSGVLNLRVVSAGGVGAGAAIQSSAFIAPRHGEAPSCSTTGRLECNPIEVGNAQHRGTFGMLAFMLRMRGIAATQQRSNFRRSPH